MMMALHSPSSRHLAIRPDSPAPAPAPALSHPPSQTNTTYTTSAPSTTGSRAAYPLPAPLYYTTLATLGLSVPVLALALIDLGTVSFFLNIPAAGLTILHDATLLRMARRAALAPPPPDAHVVVAGYYYFDPAASGFNVCVLAACALMYFAGFGMTVFSGIFAQRGDIGWETGTGMGTIVAQAALAPLVGALLLVALFQSIGMRKPAGPRLYGQF